MFNISSVLTKKSDDGRAIDTKLLGCRTNVQKENLADAKIYSGLGSSQTIDQAINNSKTVKKSEPERDIWEGSMTGLFN